MDESLEYDLIRKRLFNLEFLAKMELIIGKVDKTKLEQETTELCDKINQVCAGKPLIPVLCALCETSCTTYKQMFKGKY